MPLLSNVRFLFFTDLKQQLPLLGLYKTFLWIYFTTSIAICICFLVVWDKITILANNMRYITFLFYHDISILQQKHFFHPLSTSCSIPFKTKTAHWIKAQHYQSWLHFMPTSIKMICNFTFAFLKCIFHIHKMSYSTCNSLGQWNTFFFKFGHILFSLNKERFIIDKSQVSHCQKLS